VDYYIAGTVVDAANDIPTGDVLLWMFTVVRAIYAARWGIDIDQVFPTGKDEK